jgi:hypothetical protein
MHFPFFEITSYGRDVLKRLREDTDPSSADEYLGKLRFRAPSANATVMRCVAEALSTFNHQEYLASSVLLGVATEELLEQLYTRIGAHVSDSSDYTAKLNSKRWASRRSWTSKSDRVRDVRRAGAQTQTQPLRRVYAKSAARARTVSDRSGSQSARSADCCW